MIVIFWSGHTESNRTYFILEILLHGECESTFGGVIFEGCLLPPLALQPAKQDKGAEKPRNAPDANEEEKEMLKFRQIDICAMVRYRSNKAPRGIGRIWTRRYYNPI